ncbi:MAG: thioredoxin domain-containing protein, partial [Longimicrobiales bacterium]|nr:thioredoxin domain-containing protein [Longimicrobiales bacterium]
MPNRLAKETSPYLLQHAENPVDWFPWGEEALSKARAEDKPILLSIGYSACHWCHVMERESFENEGTAALMNEGFVSIKVDREERPDLDSIYMRAVQASVGRGGWPLTAFLTPDGRFFFGGTYFPPEARHGMPSFRQVLAAAADAYRNRREEIENGSSRLLALLQGESTPEDEGDTTLEVRLTRIASRTLDQAARSL